MLWRIRWAGQVPPDEANTKLGMQPGIWRSCGGHASKQIGDDV